MTDTPNVITVLTEDHHAVLDLISAITAMRDPDERRATADTVIAELVRHSVAEEMYVYPAMREHLADGKKLVRADIGEHQQLEVSLKALEATPGDSDDFFTRLDAVEQLLRDHASAEETTQFPQLASALSADQLGDLGRKVELAKQIAPTRPHPASPHAELFHKLVGPGVGMVDKLRDAITGRAANT